MPAEHVPVPPEHVVPSCALLQVPFTPSVTAAEQDSQALVHAVLQQKPSTQEKAGAHTPVPLHGEPCGRLPPLDVEELDVVVLLDELDVVVLVLDVLEPPPVPPDVADPHPAANRPNTTSAHM